MGSVHHSRQCQLRKAAFPVALHRSESVCVCVCGQCAVCLVCGVRVCVCGMRSVACVCVVLGVYVQNGCVWRVSCVVCLGFVCLCVCVWGPRMGG